MEFSLLYNCTRREIGKFEVLESWETQRWVFVRTKRLTPITGTKFWVLGFPIIQGIGGREITDWSRARLLGAYHDLGKAEVEFLLWKQGEEKISKQSEEISKWRFVDPSAFMEFQVTNISGMGNDL